MFKVIIADDEKIIREGIKKVVNWDKLNCIVVETAKNGKEAYEQALREKPNLMILDIRMPEMDGLSVIEKLREEGLNCKYILLTGFDEFEYAKKAVDLEVMKYLLKPIDIDQLEATLAETIERIANERLEKERISKLKLQIKESIPYLKDKFIGDLLFDPPRETRDIYEEMEYFQICIQNYTLLIAEIDMNQEMKEKFGNEDLLLLQFLVREQIERLMEQEQITYLTYLRGKRVYLIMNEQKGLQTEKLAEQISDQITKSGKFTVSIAYGNGYHDAVSLKTARREIERALEMKYHLGKQAIICKDDVITYNNLCMKPKIDLETYRKTLLSGGNLIAEAEKICELLRKAEPDYARNIVMELTSMIGRIYGEIYGKPEEILGNENIWMKTIMLADTLDVLIDFVSEISVKTEKLVHQKIYSHNHKIIQNAVAYVQENYQRDISMEEAAERVHLSKWYFSKMFKKEMGMNYSEYITKLRIDKAQELMNQEPSIKNYEMAEQVGYTDVRYFSQLFRKITGMTPSEYRSVLYEKKDI